MRLVMIVDWFFYYAAELANSLAGDAKILVVTRDHGQDIGNPRFPREAKREMLRDDIELTFVSGRQRDFRRTFDALRVRKTIRKFAPDVVHVQAHHDWALWMASTVSAPKVVTVHDVEPHLNTESLTGNRIQAWIRERVIDSAHTILVHGERLGNVFRSVHPRYEGEVVPIEMGLQAHPSRRSPLPETPTVLFFGYMHYYKGFEVLSRAARLAAERIPGLRVIVAGEGPYREKYRRDTAGEELFEWEPGFVPDEQVPEVFSRAAIVVLPYLEASQSAVVTIAYSNGRPVIASRVGGLPDIVDEGKTGLLVEPGDPKALSEAIVRLLSNRGLLQDMARNAAAKADGPLSSRAVANRHLDVYRRIAGTG